MHSISYYQVLDSRAYGNSIMLYVQFRGRNLRAANQEMKRCFWLLCRFTLRATLYLVTSPLTMRILSLVHIFIQLFGKYLHDQIVISVGDFQNKMLSLTYLGSQCLIRVTRRKTSLQHSCLQQQMGIQGIKITWKRERFAQGILVCWSIKCLATGR